MRTPKDLDEAEDVLILLMDAGTPPTHHHRGEGREDAKPHRR
jgi:hypothetical protein